MLVLRVPCTAAALQGRLVPGERAIDAPGVVKSLVFLARGQPVLVVLAGADKVDEKKLAAYLQVGPGVFRGFFGGF